MPKALNYNPGDLPSKYNSGASFAKSGVIKSSGPVRLWGVSGYNNSSSSVWVMLFDAAAVPSAGTAPDVLIFVPAGSGFGWGTDASFLGSVFADGLVWVESTTAPDLTASTTSDVYLRADYD